MSEKLKLSILSPERRLVEGVPVEKICLTGSEGQIEILEGHAPMMGTLDTGIFSYEAGDRSPVYGFISSGFFQVKDNDVCVMAETLELKSEIDVNRARRAQQLAEETLTGAVLDEDKFKKYQLKLQRSLIRQQLSNH